MAFEDLFENKDHYHEKNMRMRYPVNNGYAHESHQSLYEQTESINWLNILQKIRDNMKLKQLVILAGLLILTIVIVIIIVLQPLIIN